MGLCDVASFLCLFVCGYPAFSRRHCGRFFYPVRSFCFGAEILMRVTILGIGSWRPMAWHGLPLNRRRKPMPCHLPCVPWDWVFGRDDTFERGRGG